MSTDKQPPQTKRKLTLKEQAFCMAYTDTSNPKTFGNGTRSYMSAYPNANKGTASVQAARNLVKPRIQNEIEQILAEDNFSIRDRAKDLTRMARGIGERRQESYTVEGGVEVLTGVRVAGPTYHERLAAHDVINKLTGAYERAEQGARVEAEEFRKLLRSIEWPDKRGGEGGSESHARRRESHPPDSAE